MTNDLKFRIDLCRLSTEEKPETGLKDGSTCYEVDTKQLYIL